MPERILTLESDDLKFDLSDDASGILFDKRSGNRWRMSDVAIQEYGEIQEEHCWQRGSRFHPEQYPGRFRLEKEGDGFRATLIGRQGKPMGTFHCRYSLEGSWLKVEIPEIDEEIPSLVYPPKLDCESILLPHFQGEWHKKPFPKFGHRVWRFAGNGLNMRFFSGLREDHGWIGIVDQGFEDCAILHMGMGVAPAWLKSLGKWNSPRSVRYRCATGGYVAVAKTFRQWAKEHGLFKTLEAKMEALPELECLKGGRNLHFMHGYTWNRERYEQIWQPVPKDLAGQEEGFVSQIDFRETARIIEDAKKLGMKRGILSYHGWINGGYDETHPDIWPPEPKLGTIEELRDICTPDGPFVGDLHDNYQDIYEQSASFPQGTCRRRDGAPLAGGYWRGGQAYILNSRNALESAKRNWPHIDKLGARMYYSDTLSAEILKQSFEAGNTLSRAQDCDYKKQTMAFFKEQGIIFSSEDGCDWAVPWLDGAPQGKHSRIPGQSVPLWQLVYHDCMFGWRGAMQWSMEEGGLDQSASRIRGLENMLWGCMLSFGGFTAETWPQMRQAFHESMYMDDWHARIGTAEMLDH
ncbi:MAG: DUF5696 domain-containing protein, partial [Candidatus Sumerlaeia bacterium]